MSEKQPSTRARVRLEIEIDVPDAWGDDCPLSQIRRQALESAKGLLMRGVALNGLMLHHTGRDPNDPRGSRVVVEARIIGDPVVTAILVEREAKP